MFHDVSMLSFNIQIGSSGFFFLQVHLTSTGSSSLPKARDKTLWMTVIIVGAFILFGLPYFVAEMILSFGDFKDVPPITYAILGGIAPANSVANPFIILYFNANFQV